MTESLEKSKWALRKKYEKCLQNISGETRKKASSQLVSYLARTVPVDQPALSFVNTKEEIDLAPYNLMRLKAGTLILPRVEGCHLSFYRVFNLKDLVTNQSGFSSPDPKKCEKISLESIKDVIVPALAFDEMKSRLGRGMGCYDRLLNAHAHLKSIGVGFTEQLSKEPLPTVSHDHKLDVCQLFPN